MYAFERKTMGKNLKQSAVLKNLTNGARDTVGYFYDELRLILSDSGTILIFIIAMFIYPVLYSVGYMNETLREIPIAVVDLDHTSTSRQFSRMTDASEQLKVVYKPSSLKEAEDLFYDGLVHGIILIPDHFEKDILSGKQVRPSVYCDASYFLLYKQVYSGAVFSSGTFSAGVEIKKMLAEGKTLEQAKVLQEPLQVKNYYLYNPSGGYDSFVMPGMILIIIQQTLLIGIGMLGGTIREKKIFLKMNAPVTKLWGTSKMIFGKASAYVLIYLFNALFAMVVLHKWLALPDKGTLLGVISLLIPYLLAISFLGLAISMLFKERVHSLLFMVFISPIVMFLSGISWPTSSIPPALYWFSHIFPSTFMIPAYLRLRIMGASLESVHYEWAFLLIQMVVYFFLACFSYKIAIKRYGKNIGSNSESTNKV